MAKISKWPSDLCYNPPASFYSEIVSRSPSTAKGDFVQNSSHASAKSSSLATKQRNGGHEEMVNLYDEMKIFTGNSHPQLAQDIASYVGVPLGECEVFKFSNDNTFVKFLENVRQKDVFLIQPISKPVNDHLMELWIMIDAARRSSAGRITVVIPYYAYGRTDKKDQPRVAITARLIADFISVAGADRVLTIDLHAGQIQGFFNIPLDELSALRMLANRFREKGLSDVVVTATDAGAGKRAREVADVLDAPIAFVDKERRDNSEKAEAGNLVGDVRGKIALLIDEEISTGGTVVEAANVLLAHGATEVYCGATHAVFAGNAHERLASSRIKEFVVTDTLPIPEEKRFPGLEIISVAPLLGEAIRRIHNGDSIGAMFDEDFDLTVDRRVTTVPFATA